MQSDLRTTTNPPLVGVAAAFAAVYLIWGSTYLAIFIAVQSLPPFTMAGVRFVVAGMMLYCWTRARNVSRPPTLRQWRSALLIGGFLLLGGNGGVVWAVQVVPTGITSLIVATVPLWLVLFHWLERDGVRPVTAEVIGVILGFGGLFILVNPFATAGEHAVHLGGAAVLFLATVSWATGSLYSRRADRPTSPLLSSGMEMLCGGILLMFVGLVTGEWALISPDSLSLPSLLAVLYLIVFGSLVGFTAYMWLLRVTTPARVATYAYVNPVVAMILGWAVASEPVTARTLVAMAVILTAVAVIITYGRTGHAGKAATDKALLPSDSSRVGECRGAGTATDADGEVDEASLQPVACAADAPPSWREPDDDDQDGR